MKRGLTVLNALIFTLIIVTTVLAVSFIGRLEFKELTGKITNYSTNFSNITQVNMTKPLSKSQPGNILQRIFGFFKKTP